MLTLATGTPIKIVPMSTQSQIRIVRAALCAAVSCAVLTACAAPGLGPRPLMRAPETLDSHQSLAGAANVATLPAWPEDAWWTAFGDPQLDALVTEALASSPDVARAEARIRQAEGAALVAGAQTLPTIGGQGSAGVTKQSYNTGAPAAFIPHGWISTGSLALTGNFDLDLWGRNRKTLAAATSEETAARVDARQARLMLSTNVVSSYFELARLVARSEVLGGEVTARGELVRLARARVQQGIDNRSVQLQAEALEAQARNALSANDAQALVTRHALAALLGAGPDRGLAITPAPLARFQPTEVPADAGIALAGRRPDIVAARLRAEAAGSRIDAAKAAFLPDISLSGLIGLDALRIGDLFKGGSTYGNAGAAISLPIFQGGRLSGQFTQARGAYDLAVADYNATVIGALQDVANAQANRNAAAEREADAEIAAQRYGTASDLALQRYKAGLSTYIEALQAQTGALDARAAALDARFATLAYDIALKRALGGGYDENSSKGVD